MRYLLFATAGTALFFAVYWCFMRRETRFQMVRWYLLGTLSLAMLLPLFRISVPAAVVEPVSAEEVEPLPQQRQVVGVSAGDSPSVGVSDDSHRRCQSCRTMSENRAPTGWPIGSGKDCRLSICWAWR